MRNEAARLKQSGEELLVDLRSIRPRSRTVSAGFLLYEREQEFPTSLLVGALASRIVIFIIPFYLLVIFLTGVVADVAGTSAGQTASDLGLPELFVDATADSAAASGQWRLLAVVLTIFAVVWAGNGLGHTLNLANTVAWRQPRYRPRRRWLVPLAVIAVGLLAILANGAFAALNEPGWIDNVFLILTEVFVVAAIWLVLSRLLPRDPGANRWVDLVPGAVLMGCFVVVMKAAIALYLAPKWNSYDSRYGDIGVVLVMLAWAYLISYAAVGSAQINSALYSTQLNSGAAGTGRSWPLYDLVRTQWRQFRGKEKAG